MRGVRRLTSLAVLLAAVLAASTGGLPARADTGEDTVLAAQAGVASLQAQLAAARSDLEARRADLDAWSRRLDAADRDVVDAEREAVLAGPVPAVLDDLRLGIGRPTVAQVRVADARRRLEAVRSAPVAADALRDSFALQTRVGDLEAQLASATAWTDLLATPGIDDPAAAEPTAGDWARMFLTTIGAPQCDDNVIAMLAWQAQESTSARFNPLATTYEMPGATAFNSVGVRNFVTIAQGLEASRATLELPVDTYGYAVILSSLRACAPAETTAWYVNASAWCRGCSGGTYLTALIPLVRADPDAYAART